MGPRGSAFAHQNHRARRIRDIPVVFHALATSPEPAVKQNHSLRVFPSQLSLHFQRIIKISITRSCFPFLISEHLVPRWLELSWCCRCPVTPVTVTVPSIPTSAQRPGGAGVVHILPPPHSWTSPFPSAVLALGEILPCA